MARLGQAAGELPSERRAAYTRIDPLLRPLVRSRVRAALAEAVLATEHALDEGHVHRLAFLTLRGRAPHVDEVAGIRDAFMEELARRPASRPSRWLASSMAIALPVLACVLLAAYRWGPDHWFDASLEPISPQAFQHGGRPDPGSRELAEFFADTLPDFVVALDSARSGDGAALHQTRQAVVVRATTLFGRDTASFLRAVLEQAEELARAGEMRAVDGFLRSVDAFNAALERSGLGYYLDAEVVGMGSGARVYLASFVVRRVQWFAVNGRRVRALRLVRSDTLNFARGVLGFTRPTIRDALVLEERVDGWLIRSVLPALAKEGRFVLAGADPGAYAPKTLPRLERRVADEARKELAKLAGDCSAFAATTELFARRAAVFRDLGEQAIRAALVVREPSGYDISVDQLMAMRERALPDTWRELNDVADELDTADQRGCFRALRAPLLASIERHEVQHRLDFQDGTLEQLPIALERRVGPLDAYGLRSVGAELALAETSAYLAELARGKPLVKLNLAMLAQHVIDRTRWRSVEYFAALVIFEGLTRQLGLETSDPSAKVAPERVANALGLFMAMSEDELSRAAARLWADLMGRPLPNLRAER
jgi:hypothetical protein